MSEVRDVLRWLAASRQSAIGRNLLCLWLLFRAGRALATWSMSRCAGKSMYNVTSTTFKPAAAGRFQGTKGL